VIFTRPLRAGLACIMLLASQTAFAQGGRHPKLDRALRDALRTGGGTQHVIITVKAGYRAEIRAALEKHGGRQEPAWRELGLASRHVLHRLMKKHGIRVEGDDRE
jgi:transcriptional regulator with GAF, ATPase, and Fis domain